MPKQITSEELCSVIGEELLQKCLEQFKGKQFYFHKKSNTFSDNNERNEFIFNACTKSGCNIEKVAEMVHLSPEYVQKIYYQEIKNRHGCKKQE